LIALHTMGPLFIDLRSLLLDCEYPNAQLLR